MHRKNIFANICKKHCHTADIELHIIILAMQAGTVFDLPTPEGWNWKAELT